MDSQKLKFNFPKEILRREIINGKVYMMAGASSSHNEVVGNLFYIFKNFLRGKRCRVYGENLNVKFDKDSPEVLPDIKIVCDPEKIKKNGIDGAPDLIVEVISPRTKVRDETTKKELYEKYGVKEYWIINPNDKSIDVYLLKDGKFVRDNIYVKYEKEDIEEIESVGDEDEMELLKITTIKTSLYGDDLEINIADIFEGVS